MVNKEGLIRNHAPMHATAPVTRPSRAPATSRFPNPADTPLTRPLLAGPFDLRACSGFQPQSPSVIPSTFHELIHSQTSTCPALICLLGPWETATWTSLKYLKPSLSQTQGSPRPATLISVSVKDSHPHPCPGQRPGCPPQPPRPPSGLPDQLPHSPWPCLPSCLSHRHTELLQLKPLPLTQMGGWEWVCISRAP